MKKKSISILLLLITTTWLLYSLPVLSVLKIYPLPAKGYTNIEFFQQLGSSTEVELNIYDIDGNKIPNIDYSIESVLNMKKRAKVTTTNLQAGVYICQIKYNVYSCYAKFIVE